MGFETNQTNGNSNRNDESWKAQGFINIYLPTREGGKRKLGSIPLRDSDPREKIVRERLETGGEEAIVAMQGKLIIEYNSATPTEGSAFDF